MGLPARTVPRKYGSCKFWGIFNLGRYKVNTLLGFKGDDHSVWETDGRILVKILGTLQIRTGDVVLDAGQLGGPKARQILEILLLHLGTPVSKSRLIDMLWDGSAPLAAVSTLESYVSVLRRCLQPGQGKNGVLRTTTGGYVLDPGVIDLDLSRFDSLVLQAEGSAPQVALPLLRQALAMATEPLLGSELLPEWAEAERCLHAVRVSSVGVLAAQMALELGMAPEAIRLSQDVLDRDVLNEAAWICLVLGLELGGNPLQGLQALDRCRRVMDRELGCSPGPVLQNAQERLLCQTSASDDDFGHVIGALLSIQEVVSGHASEARPRAGFARKDVGFSPQEAGNVIFGYLQRALGVAAV